MKRREFITLLGGAVSVFLCVSAAAQEGYYGIGHDKWHRDFYSKLKRNDGRGPCCSLMDCRPTQSRMVGDHYEVKVDGAWTPVPYDKINNVMVALTSALRDRWVRTGAFYSASFCRRRADESTEGRGHGRAKKACGVRLSCAVRARGGSDAFRSIKTARVHRAPRR
jgi:hypothetical protein